MPSSLRLRWRFPRLLRRAANWAWGLANVGFATFLGYALLEELACVDLPLGVLIGGVAMMGLAVVPPVGVAAALTTLTDRSGSA